MSPSQKKGSVSRREKWSTVLVAAKNKKELDFTSWWLCWTLKIVIAVEITFLLDCVKERMLWTFNYGELIDVTNTHIHE